jgi:hypothetical protein
MQLIHGWQSHLDRHADHFATKMRTVQRCQHHVNGWRRTIGMCSGNRASLGSRLVLGQPRRTMDAIALLLAPA